MAGRGESSSDADAESTMFARGDGVWCMYNNIYYKAKILKVGLKIDNEQYYLIHYFKFSKKFDEPVRESRLLSINNKNDKFVKKYNKNSSDERKKKKEVQKLKEDIQKSVDGLPITEQRPFLKLERLSREIFSMHKEHENRNVISDSQPLEEKKEHEQKNNIESIDDKSQQLSTSELQLNNFPSTSEQDLEQVAIKTLDNMLTNSLKRQHVTKLDEETEDYCENIKLNSSKNVVVNIMENEGETAKNQSQFSVYECEEVTTSNKEEELLFKNQTCLVNSNDDDTVNKIMINNEDEVTTSKSDDQLMLDDQQDISSFDKSCCNVHEISLSAMKSNSFGTTTVMRTSEEPMPEIKLNYKRLPSNADINNLDEEVTTSKLDELRLDDQGNIISSIDNLVGNDSSGNENVDEEVTTSKQEYCKGLNCHQNIICYEINRCLASFYGGPIRISRVSIVAERLGSENMDVHEQNILHETNSLGTNTSLVITTALSEKEMDNEERNTINCEDKTALHKTNVSLKLDDKIEHFNVPSGDSHIGCKTNHEFNKNYRFNKSDSFGNASPMMLEKEVDNKKRQIDDIDGDNVMSKKMKTYSTDKFNNKKSDISPIKENDLNKKEASSFPVITPHFKMDMYGHCSKITDEENINIKEVLSTYVAASNCNKKIDNFYNKTADENDINLNKVKALSASTVTSNNVTKIVVKECNKTTYEDDINMKEIMSTPVAASNYNMKINNFYNKSVKENDVNLNEVKALSTSSITPNNETKIVEECNKTTYEDEINIKEVISTFVAASKYNNMKIDNFYRKTADENDINLNEVKALSTSTITSNNETKIVEEYNNKTYEENINIKEVLSKFVAASNCNEKIDNFYNKTADENDINLNKVKSLSTPTVTSNNETKIVKECNKTTYGKMSNDNSALSSDENNYSLIINSSPSTTVKIKNNRKNKYNDYGKTDESNNFAVKDEESSTLRTVLHEKKTSISLEDAPTEVSKSSLQKKSNGSEASSSSTPLSNNLVESDNENDGQTSDDDDRDVKNKKVTTEKLSDEDHSIFELFGYEKSYSRAAKVKANEAISQMSKPPISKEKKNETVKRIKNGKKKDDDDISDETMTLSHYNLDVPLYVHRILIEDKHLVEDDRFIPRVPAKLSVFSILHDYASKFPVCEDTLDTLFDAFNMSLDKWLLHPLEKPKYNDILQKYPNNTMSQIYGLPHLLRFLLKLPRLFHMIRNNSTGFIPKAVHFVRGLLIYLVDENLPFSIQDYDPVLPDSYRRAYYL